MAIRYDKKLNAEIKRVVSNFNKKVKRLEQQEQDLIPEKIKISELKKIYQDRKQLKRRLKQLKDFGKRGAEQTILTPGGVEITKWGYETARADYIMIKRRLSRQIKIETPKTPSPYLKKERLQNAEDRLAEMQKSFKDLTVQELQKVEKTIEIEIKRKMGEDIFKNNLLKRLGSALELKGYDPSILERFKGFTGEQLLNIYNNEQELEDIMNFSNTLTELIDVEELVNNDGNARITSNQFDAILNKMINRMSYYEKTYK